MENSPTRLHVEAVVLSRFIQLLLENFSGFRSASLEHNASSAERVLPTLGAKIGIYFESCKKNEQKREWSVVVLVLCNRVAKTSSYLCSGKLENVKMK